MKKTEEKDCKKKKIIEMVEKIKEEKSIHMIYGFVKRLYENSKGKD